MLLDEAGNGATSILAGRAQKSNKSITLNKDVLKRHTAVLGGSGSGKTTLALCIIEQLLLKGTPAVLIDRKGDLCSYANPDVWRALEGELGERRGEREKLADSIDVAVYTPGRASGRPISITLLPNGINELPDQEQQLLANLSSAALGDMLHFKNSATHQKQSGTLSVALRILGGRSSKEVTLHDLIQLLEDEDPELSDLTQRMDPSGRIRRDLVAQLDSLRHRNSALFEGGGEPLRMDALLGKGRYGRDNRTRLSIIYTGFLGDNENILFWVSQFLSEALRFCQRNPNDELQAVVMFDEADLYIPANSKPATAEPLQSLLEARPLGRPRHHAGHPVAGRPRLQVARPDHLVVHRPRARGHGATQAARRLPERVRPRSERRAAAPDGRRVPSRAGGTGAADAGPALAHQRRAGAVRSHRAAGARDQGPGREAAQAVR